MNTERPDWQDGQPLETETAVVPRGDDGRVVRPDWSDEPLAPAVEAPVTNPVASGDVAGARVGPDRPDWNGEEIVQRVGQSAQENSMHPADVVPDTIFVSPEDVGEETAPAIDVAKAILQEDAGWSDTIAGFTEHLSTTAQNVLVAEMAVVGHSEAEPLSSDQIVGFTATPEGRELWEEWGNAAPEKAAMARARLDRLTLALPEHEVAIFDALFDSLPPAAFKKAIRQLAG